MIAHAEHGFTRTCRSRSSRTTNALLATHADGEPLTPEHGWPLRLVDPGQVLLEEREVAARRSSCSATDQPGFWERYGYHNDADPWKEERYEF